MIMIESEGITENAWYIKNYGPDVDHSQIVQLEALRRGIWGTKDLWGRVFTFNEETPEQIPREIA
jgi:phosphosulfolactate synthase (CoM biosynthesis protein A)